MRIITNTCSKFLPEYANNSALPSKNTLPCDEKAESLRPMMKMLGDMTRSCVSYKDSSEVPLEERKNMLNPKFNEMRKDMVMNPVLDLIDTSKATSTDCTQYCTNQALSDCTWNCAWAISVCSMEPYSSTCISYAYSCFWDMPVCCDCAAYYDVCSCSVCGY
mmetsp:Transcript_25673/g.36814  ORF Transcript_25673/g.36814 Transcript_25673/m.36814 type:complete len:162 (-) Transcript_25673:236-721(-)